MRHAKQLGIVLPLTFLLLSFAFLGSAFAATHDQLRAYMNRLYDPAIKSFVAPDGMSGWGCYLDRVFVDGRDPVTRANRTVNLKQYRPAPGMPSSGRAIMVMPPTGGENPLDNKWANEFCKRGFRVVIVQSWNLFSDEEIDLRMYDRTAIRAIAAMLHTSEFLKQSGAKSIGLLGTSLGAIQGAAAVAYDPKISVGVFIVGGIHLGEILAASDEATIAKTREIRKDMWKMSQDQYLQKIEAATTVEPADFIGMSGPKKVLSVIATKDTTVPTRNQELLWEAFGKQDVIRFDTNHIGAVKKAGLFKPTYISNFFDANLAK